MQRKFSNLGEKKKKDRKKVLGFGFNFFSHQQKLKPSERW